MDNLITELYSIRKWFIPCVIGAIILVMLIFIGISRAEEYTYSDYYEYAEEFFYYQHNSQPYYQKDKDNFCIILATELYSKKANLEKLKNDLMKKDPLNLFVKDCPLKKEYREWEFVNRKELLLGEEWGNCFGYSLGRISDYNLIYERWFKHYITLKELEKKWKGKSMPKGMDEFLKKCKYRCYER